nr:hypothetical protein [Tanacetum cinerariifolium]
LKLKSIKDAKKFLEAIEKRFGRNAATKKTQRNLLKQQYENCIAPSSKMLDQTFDRLQNLVSQLDLLEENLLQEDVNQNTNGAINTAYEISTASTQVNAAYFTNIYNLSDAIICSFFASQPNIPQLVHEDLEQILPGRKQTVNDNETIGFDNSNVECYNFHKMGHFAMECRAPRNQDNKHKKDSKRSVPVETYASTTFVSCNGLGGYAWSDQAEEGPSYALMAFSSSSSNLEVSNYSTCLETVKLIK